MGSNRKPLTEYVIGVILIRKYISMFNYYLQ